MKRNNTLDDIAERAKRGNLQRALEILRKPRIGEPPREGDELPDSWKDRQAVPAPKPRAKSLTRSK